MIITDKDKIIAFLKGETGDHLDRTLEDHLSISDYDLEKCHDRIQWMFPLHEISRHANTYPVITPEVINEAKQYDIIFDNLRKAKVRFEQFLGIGDYEDVDKQRKWCRDRNHNLLRITRVIRCLRLFGLQDEAFDFYAKVYKVGQHFGIESSTQGYWGKAYRDDVWESLQG